MADWNAEQYLIFHNERTQPSTDLINRIDTDEPSFILDVGCGPGNSTAQLAAKYPRAVITGIDSSPDMIERAGTDHPDIEFIRADITEAVLPAEHYDIVFANAVIQWIPDHYRLIGRLFGLVRPGGVLACQIPMNRKEPSHRNIRLLAGSEKWKDKFDGLRIFHNLTPAQYYDLFGTLTDDFSMWLTTYFHTMKDHRDIVEWLKGTGLRPYLEGLSPSDAAMFEQKLIELYVKEYPRQANGDVVLMFPRFFFILKK